MSLNELSKKIYNANVEKGFYEDYNDIKAVLSGVNNNLLPVFERFVTAQRLALITSEVSEVLEANRKGNTTSNFTEDGQNQILNEYDNEMFNELFVKHIKDSEQDEIADIIIRCLDFCGANKIDIDFNVKAKMRYNSLRPHKHGKKY